MWSPLGQCRQDQRWEACSALQPRSMACTEPLAEHSWGDLSPAPRVSQEHTGRAKTHYTPTEKERPSACKYIQSCFRSSWWRSTAPPGTMKACAIVDAQRITQLALNTREQEAGEHLHVVAGWAQPTPTVRSF